MQITFFKLQVTKQKRSNPDDLNGWMKSDLLYGLFTCGYFGQSKFHGKLVLQVVLYSRSFLDTWLWCAYISKHDFASPENSSSPIYVLIQSLAISRNTSVWSQPKHVARAPKVMLLPSTLTLTIANDMTSFCDKVHSDFNGKETLSHHHNCLLSNDCL